MTRAPGRVTFRSVLALSEFRALWAAELFSVAGDQLARVALALIVFARTDSAGWTAVTYALTFAPAFLGGMLLGGLGDRYPRRDVMVASDLIRAVLVGLMALPGMPLIVLCGLVAMTTFAAGPFKAAQQAMLPDLFAGNKIKYEAGQSLRTATSQTAQLLGFAGGGVLVTVLSPTVGLLVDAGTFLISAAIVRTGVRPRAAAGGGSSSTRNALVTVARLVWSDPTLRTSFALCWLVGFYVTPEALAAPYAAALGMGPSAVGWLMASDPAGSVLGGVLWGAWVPAHRRDRLAGILAPLAGVPLILCLLQPGIVASMVLFAVMGMLVTAYLIQASAVFTLNLPERQRAHGAGLFSSGLLTTQGVGALGAGMLADRIGPVVTVAAAGAAGTLVALPVAVTWWRRS